MASAILITISNSNHNLHLINETVLLFYIIHPHSVVIVFTYVIRSGLLDPPHLTPKPFISHRLHEGISRKYCGFVKISSIGAVAAVL